MKTKETMICGHKLKFRRWTYGQKLEAMRNSSEIEEDLVTGEVKTRFDPWLFNVHFLAATLISWDLKGEDDEILPITFEDIMACEDTTLIDQAIAFSQKLNEITPKERFLSSKQ